MVFDIGTTSTRAGYAGEDTPRAMFPTSFGYSEEPDTDPETNNNTADGDVTMTEASTENNNNTKKTKKNYYIGDSKVNTWRENMEVRNPLKDGLGKSILIWCFFFLKKRKKKKKTERKEEK